MQIQIKPINRKTDRLALTRPTTALQFRKNELAQLASGRNFTLTLIANPTVPWAQIEVVDGYKRKHIVEVFDRFSVKCQCSCEEFFEDCANYCVHIAALDNVKNNQVLFRMHDRLVPVWYSAYHRKIANLPIALMGYRNPKFTYYDSANQVFQSFGGSLPGAVDSSATKTAKKLKALLSAKKASAALLPEPDDTGLLTNLALYDYQKAIFAKMVKAKRAICSMTMGAGKSSPVTSKVLTPQGWKLMGEISVGDFVIGSNGKPTRVIGVYPQGQKDTYRVTFTDDSSMECCDEHLWAVRTPQQKYRNGNFTVRELRTFMNSLTDQYGNHKYHIPMVKPVEFPKKEVELDPYLLGALIGDGGISQKSLSFSSMDEFLITEISNRLPSGVSIKQKKNSVVDWSISRVPGTKKENVLTLALRKLHLAGKRSYEKHIPEEYKYNDSNTRLLVLQGLMDTDGFCDKSGKDVIFYSTSKQLALDVQEIVWSFGGTAVLKNKQTEYVYKGAKKIGRPSFAVYISLPPGIVPFRLPRKLERFVPRTKYQPTRYFKSVEFVGKLESQCIAVEADDHLYVADNYIVTHNTLTTICCYSWIRKNAKSNPKLLVVCPKSLRLQWQSEIKRAIGIESIQVTKPTDLQKSGDIFIVTYQYFTRHAEVFSKAHFDCVVADEIQFVKNADTKTWKAMSKIKSEYFYGLSGTVIENRLDDLYHIMEIVSPGFLGPKWKFDDKYQNLISISKAKILYKGAKNIPALQAELKDYVFSYDQLALPKITHTTINTVLTQSEISAHDEFMEKAKELIAKSLNGGGLPHERLLIQAYLLKARQACNGEELLTKNPSSNPSSKIKEFLKLVDDVCIKRNEKLVVFSEWTEMLDICKRHLSQKFGASLGWVNYTGKETPKQRAAALTKFQTDPKCMLFFASEAGGVGLDGLQLVAWNVVHLELPWNPSRLDQRTGRVYRLLQKNPVNVFCLVSNGGIEKQISKLLTEKREVRELTLKELTVG